MTVTGTETAASTSEAQPRRRGFRADIQGLRAIAVGLVLLYHAGVPLVTGGYVGVDVFFVISGFLISSHLLESLQRTGRIDFADFYARRIRRILPASLTVAVLTALAAVIFYPPLALERVVRDAVATILYVPNIWFAIQNTDYLADHSPSPYQHYWSLGVEEQFYLLWPLLLFGLVVVFRRRKAAVVLGIAALAVLSLVAGIWMTPINQPMAFFLLPTRAWELLAGALAGAVLLHSRTRLPVWLASTGGWLGIVMIAASALIYDDRTVFPGTAALLPTVGTALVILFGADAPRGGPGWLLSIRPMQFVGLISYSLYLVHWPLLIVTQAAVGEEQPLRLAIKVLLGIVLALPLAWLLFRFVETPLRAPGWLTRRRPRATLWGTLGVTVVLTLSLLATAQWASTRDVGTGEPVAAAPDFPTIPPNASSAVPRNMTPALDEVADDVAEVYADGCHHDVEQESVQDCVYGDPDGASRVAVFGDSHSAQWLPAVEEIAETTGGISIHSYTKSSCPAVAVTVLDKDVPYVSCDRWRSAVLDALIADPPDLVLISSYSHYALVGAGDDSARTDLWADGVRTTVSALEDAGSEVLVIADTPRFDAAPATCASANPMDVSTCAGDRAQAFDVALTATESEAVVTAGGHVANLSDYICGESSCPVIVDDLFVYRDVNHLTASFVRYLAPALRSDVEELLSIGSSPAP